MERSNIKNLLVLILSLTWVGIGESHVALVFPPARKYALDFLDTFRTVKPCGMERGDIVTSIPNNENIEITWHLGYPHQGGYKLEILDKNGNHVRDITPKDQYVGEKTTQSFSTIFPQDFTCTGCTIRLVRQALDFGKKYEFQSCADVDIVNKADFVNDCSGRGTLTGGVCKCEKPYYTGDRCQFIDECATDQDCGEKGGVCIDLQGTAYPRKQCFCKPGYFGKQCTRKSSLLKEKVTNFTSYKQNSFGTTTKLYWKLLDDGLFEAIITAATTSYLAVGWRPADADKSCHEAFPTDATKIIGRDFSNMDCLDIVLGAVKQGSSRIRDYYTRDRSTPQLDEEFWGQTDDLKAAFGWEEDGKTYIRFIKSVATNGGSDHEFYGNLHVVWAHGRDDIQFYSEDEIKYHGPNRGYAKILVGTAPLSNQQIVFITAMVLLVLLMIIQGIHNLTRKKIE